MPPLPADVADPPVPITQRNARRPSVTSGAASVLAALGDAGAKVAGMSAKGASSASLAKGKTGSGARLPGNRSFAELNALVEGEGGGGGATAEASEKGSPKRSSGGVSFGAGAGAGAAEGEDSIIGALGSHVDDDDDGDGEGSSVASAGAPPGTGTTQGGGDDPAGAEPYPGDDDAPMQLFDADAIRQSKILARDVTLKGQQIDPPRMRTVVETHFNRKQLQKLQRADLDGNRLGLGGAELLSRRLRASRCALQFLALGGNLIGDLGVQVTSLPHPYLMPI